SPLSANVNFGKHWDNFPVLMSILRFYYPDGASAEQLKQAVDAFGDAHSNLAGTIAGWKYNTITYIWNNRERLYSEIKAAAKKGDDVDLLSALVKIPGVAPVKAGF